MKNFEMLTNNFFPNKILIPLAEFTKILEDQLYPNIISRFIKEKSDFCLKTNQILKDVIHKLLISETNEMNNCFI